MAGEQPIRVLQSVGAMNYGGIENFVMNVYRKVDRSLVQFDFAERVAGPCAFDGEIQELGGRIYRFQSPDRHPLAARRFYDGLFAAHPEWRVVHEHRSTCSGFMALLRSARAHGVQCRTVQTHNSTLMGFYGGVGNVVERVTDRINKPHVTEIATDYLACSDKAAEWMYPRPLIDAGRVKVLQNGIDVARFAYSQSARNAVREELGIAPGAFVVGHVGRFTEAKNHAFLLEAFAGVARGRPGSRLLLLGEGALEADARSRAEALGLSGSVVFAGTRADVAPYYSAMDAFCMPSLYEGLPLAAVEAQASGLPTLLSENVSRDAGMTCLAEFLPLEAGAAAWTRALLAARRDEARSAEAQRQVREAGFDSADVAAWLQDFYLRKSGEVAR